MRISDWSSDVCSSDLVARLPRAPALVRLGHAAACLVGGVAGAVAAPLRRLDRLGAPDSAALAGLAGGAALGLRLPPAQSLWRTRPRRRACRVQIGRAHVETPVPHEHLVFRFRLEKKNINA